MSLTLPPLRGSATIDIGPAEAALGKLKSAASGFGKALQDSVDREGGAAFKSLSSNAEMFGSVASGAFKVVAYGAAGLGAAMTAAAAAFAFANKSLLDFSDRIVTMHQRTRIGTDSLQVLSHMAKVSGTDLGTLGRAVTLMSVNIAKGDDSFKKLGLSLSELKKSSPDEAFAKVSTAIGGLASPMQQAAAAVAIFGRSGAELLPVFATNMEKAREETERLGLVLDGKMIFSSEALGDAIDTSTEALVKFGERLAGVVQQSPAAIMAVEGIGSAFGNLSKFVDDNKATLQKWANIAAVALSEVAASAATAAGMAVSIGKYGGMGWLVELSGVEKLTDGLKRYTQGAQDALLAKIKWQATDMGGKGVLLPGGVLPKQGATGGVFDATGEAARQGEKSEALAKKAEAAWEKAVDAWGDVWEMEQKGAREIEARMAQSTIGSVMAKSAPGSDPFAWMGIDRMGVPYDNGNSGYVPPRSGLYTDQAAQKAKEAAEAQAKAAETAARWAGALQGVALIAGAIGGKIGATAQVMGNIAESFKGFKDMDKYGKFNAVAGGVGQIGGLIGGSAGAGIQGAAGGAMSGFAVGGPVGAVVGGALGGIMGLFGASQAKKKELTDLKAQLTGLSDEAKKFGISLDAAFASKNSSVVKGAIDQVNAAMKESEKRIAGLKTFTGGLNQWAQSGGITGQASSDRAGRFAMASFGAQMKESGDVFGALDSIAPTLEAMAQAAKEMGTELPKGVSELLKLNDLDEGLKSQVSGLNMMTKGIADAGLVSKAMFDDLGAEAVATRARLEEAGIGGAQALGIMQPSLQQLYEMQKLHGYAVDETTQSLLDEAKAQNLVGDQFMSTGAQMVELMKALILAVGGELPAAFQTAAAAAESSAGRMRGAMDGVRVPGGGGVIIDGGIDGEGPGFAGGTAFRNFGSGTQVTLHGEEAVLTRPQVERLVSMAVSGATGSTVPQGGGGQPIIVYVMADGEVLGTAVASTIQRGGPAGVAIQTALAGRA